MADSFPASEDGAVRILQDRQATLERRAISFMEGLAPDAAPTAGPAGGPVPNVASNPAPDAVLAPGQDAAAFIRAQPADRSGQIHTDQVTQPLVPGLRDIPGNLAAGARAVAADVGTGIVNEGGMQALGGVLDAVRAAGTLTQYLKGPVYAGEVDPKTGQLSVRQVMSAQQRADKSGQNFDKVLGVPEAKTITGGLIRGVSQFLTGFATGTKTLSLAGDVVKAGNITRTTAASMFADFAAFDGHEERLSNLIQSAPALQNPVNEYLASDMSDGELQGRLKNVMEGAFTDAVLTNLVRSIHSVRLARKVRRDGETYAQAAKRLSRDPNLGKSIVPDVTAHMGPDAPITFKPGDVAKLGEDTQAYVDSLTPAKADGAAPDPVRALAVSDVPTDGQNVYVNWSRINTPEDVKQVIQNVADADKAAIDAARRGTRSNARTALDANHLNAWDLLVERRQGQPMNAEQSLAVRRLWAASGEKLTEAARLVQSAPTPQNTFLFRRALAMHGMIQREVIAARTETARALQQWSIPAGSSEMVARQIGETVTMYGGEDVASDIASRIVGAADQGNFAAIDSFARKGAWAASRDAVFESWVNGLLSNPVTHVVNAVSNTGVALLSIAERSAAEKIGKVLGRSDGVDAGEASAMLYGAVTSLRDAWRVMGEAFVSGKSGFGLQKLEAPRTRSISTEALGNTRSETFNRAVNMPVIAQGINAFGALVTVPGRALGAADEFFKTISYRMEVHAQAARQASQELRAGAIAPEALKTRMAELADTPPDSVALQAREFAQYNTFTNDPGKMTQWINKGRSQFPLLRYIAPFVNTPANIVRFAAERSPAGALMPGVWAEIRAGGRRADLALAKMGIGSVIMWTGFDYALNGQITGGGPSDPRQRAALYRTGWRPYSIKAGDRYFAYNRIDPFGAQLGVMANLAERALNSDTDPGQSVEETIYGSIGAIGEQATDKTYFRGPAELFRAMSDPRRYMKGYLEKFASGFVPFSAAVNKAETIVDPTLSRTSGTMERIQSRVPWLSERTAKRHDLWGREISFQSGLGAVYDAASPVYSSKVQAQPIDTELLKLGYFPGLPSSKVTISREQFSLRKEPKLYERYLVLQGATPASEFPVEVKKNGKPTASSERMQSYGDRSMMQVLNAIVTGKHALAAEYDAADEYGKERMIKRVIGDFRERARARLIRENPKFFAPGTGKR